VFIRGYKGLPMKFIADAMLGTLAKRMRLLGLDVLYDPDLDDNEVIRLSLEQDRVILTRDTGLAARPLAANHLAVKSERTEEQLDEVLAAFPAEHAPLTRCSECNGRLVSAAKQDVQDLVPQFVYDSIDVFFQCPNCKRIYWKGSHVKRMGLRGKK
jgi:uncharacterized protein with PIN domain